MSAGQDQTVAELLGAVARQMAEVASEDWTRVRLSASAHEHGVGGPGLWIDQADGGERSGGFLLLPELRQVSELDDSGADQLAIEVSVDVRGGFEAFTSRAISRDLGSDTGGLVYALRPGVRVPDPGDDEDGPLDATQAGDPREAVEVLRRYLGKRAEISGQGTVDTGWDEGTAGALPEPLDAARIARLEGSVPVPLPDDLRALYAVANGDDAEGLLCGHDWFGLHHVVSLHSGPRWWAAGETWRYHRLDRVRLDAGPLGAVRRSVDRPGWIPFTTDTGGNFLAVDMDPAAGGRPGQVIRVGRDYGEGAVHVAESVTALLRSQLEALERGSYTYDADSGHLWTEADLPDRHPEALGHFTTDAAAAALDEVQTVRLRDERDTDLAPLRGARRLRRMALHQGVPVDLTPLRDIPVEALELGLHAADLAPLAGHPTLRTVKIRDARPVELAPLRECPKVYGLDLSGASVRDIEVVAEMKGLLYLSLRYEQWAELWQRVDGLPGLAAAGLAEGLRPSGVAEWAGHFPSSGPGDDLRHYSGRWDA
ncbi:SMI1/KNR4 family protein [Streptomyces avicenniae]|uniref:SMI1/KNR4 family protein n=1 Tax=Streptomyces avicenniae TaxID=500153 RepID=UPI00069C9B6B|nr:SMI1/KNR4 family protein [Streptomyces avicenniae]